jgi:cold shock CspA family protein
MPKGTVTHIHKASDGGSGFGFINSDAGGRVYFSAKLARLIKVQHGDRVEFEFGKFAKGKGPTANFMTVIDDDDDNKVTTIWGENDYVAFDKTNA